jgi:hypothetical protein
MSGLQILQLKGGERRLGQCYGVDTTLFNGVERESEGFRYCQDNFGVGPSLSDHVMGDVAKTFYLRNERVVAYLPYLRYRGPDYFTYKIYDGQTVQKHVTQTGKLGDENQVALHVRDCRTANYLTQFNISSPIHPLCTCQSNELSLVGDSTACNLVRASLCTDKTTATYGHFESMCLACRDKVITVIKESLSLDPPVTEPQVGLRGECLAQTMRAVSMLKNSGLCSTTPFMDCSAESITAPGRERINYLSLKTPPGGGGGFSQLGASFKGTGWFGSPLSGTP